MPARRKSTLEDSQTAKTSFRSKLQRVWGESVFYQAQLRGPAPDRFLFAPSDPRTPDDDVAMMIARGKFSIGSESIDCEGELATVWDRLDASGPLFAFLQDFSWLRHAAAAGDEGLVAARELTQAWLDRYDKWSPDAWAPFLTAERLTQLCCHGGQLLKSTDALWRSRLLASMARQTRHLERSSHKAGTGYERLLTALGLTVAGLCLPGCDAPADHGLEILRRELRLQLRPDGGHVSRNPSHQLSIVIRLQMVEQALAATNRPAPGFIKHVAARAGSYLYMFRCGDGGLAVFNGGYEDDGKAVLHALKAAEKDDAPTGFARHSGFQRIDAGRMALVVDTGVSSRSASSGSKSVYGSTSSFHLSSGRSRLVVNCGNGAHLSRDWVKALRAPAAHSRISEEEPSAEGALFTRGAVTHRRGEDVKGQLLEVERVLREEGGAAMRYVRRFYLAAQGGDLRGEDRLTGVSRAFVDGLSVRFHLHPSVKASVSRDRRTILLAASNQEGWRFRSNCQNLTLEKSVYCGGGALPVSTEQIVLRLDGLEPTREGDMLLRWGFRRVDGASNVIVGGP